ncbi:MAG: hypothetical protein EPN33_14600 [Acidobacteria bacterium]|nr:MAG: hypothetical protein EPN33_14600 [Acidobacteriota bacterium]
MPRFNTAVPLLWLRLDAGRTYPFVPGLTIAPIPDWLRGDTGILNRCLSGNDRALLKECSHCLLFDYAAEALHAPDPGWVQGMPHSIQDAKAEQAFIVNLALWLRRPTPVGFTFVAHAPESNGEFVIQSVEAGHQPFLCLRRERDQQYSEPDLEAAAAFYETLVAIPRASSPWAAIRTLTIALRTMAYDLRFLLFWMALESLFGTSSGELAFRISQRIAFFIGDDDLDSRKIFAFMKRSYGLRSKIVHGVRAGAAHEMGISEESLYGLETCVRRALGIILQDRDMRAKFIDQRATVEKYLDQLAFSKRGDPPTGVSTAK